MIARFLPGHRYMAGAERPFFVTLASVRGGAEALGFSHVVVSDAEDMAPPIEPPTHDYDTIGAGTWSRPESDLTLPDEVRWIVDVTPEKFAAPTPPASPSVGNAALVIALFGAIAIGGALVYRYG